MEEITSLSRYDCAYDVLREYCGAEFWQENDAEDDVFLRNFDDFTGYVYFCINGETIVITDVLGGVVGRPQSFLAFLREVEDLLAQDREDR